MQARQPDAEQRYQAVIGQVTSDAGLMMDRARYLRDSGYEQAARDLFARSHNFTYKPADPERFLDMMVLLSKARAGDRQWQTAYNIARQVDDVFAPGADISLKSYGIRDKYTTLTWTAGTVALERMNRARDAIAMFDKYAGAGRSLQVKTKGWYWAGRASSQAGDPTARPQLFRARLGDARAVLRPAGARAAGPDRPAPAGTPSLLLDRCPAPGIRTRSGWFGRSGCSASRACGTSRACSSAPCRKISTAMPSGCWRSNWRAQIWRPDLAVWTARSARNAGNAFYYKATYPTHSASVPAGRMWSLVHGITRQESSFDRAAVSRANARGHDAADARHRARAGRQDGRRL